MTKRPTLELPEPTDAWERDTRNKIEQAAGWAEQESPTGSMGPGGMGDACGSVGLIVHCDDWPRCKSHECGCHVAHEQPKVSDTK